MEFHLSVIYCVFEFTIVFQVQCQELEYAEK